MGSDISLTVDQNACAAAYNALGAKTGRCWCTTTRPGRCWQRSAPPTFDPNAVPEDIETNEAYKGAYSTTPCPAALPLAPSFKIVTAAAAMEKYPDTWSSLSYDCQGSVTLGESTVTCLHGNAHGTQDLAAALGNSCNVYFAQLANDLGAEALQQKAEEMGFNTQLDFSGISVSQSTIDLSGANANELGWAGVGQYTVLSNPYHMMVLMGPSPTEASMWSPGSPRGRPAVDGLTGGSRQLVTATEAQNLKTLLRNNVEYYYGDYLFPSGMNVCAKTGTGEVGEDQGPNCWMVGFGDSPAVPLRLRRAGGGRHRCGMRAFEAWPRRFDSVGRLNIKSAPSERALFSIQTGERPAWKLCQAGRSV